jgi:hypothetical protein
MHSFGRKLIAVCTMWLMVAAVGLVAQPGVHAGEVTSSSATNGSVESLISWGPVTRHCTGTDSCRVRATGGAGRQTHYRDGNVVQGWSNSGNATRTSWHGFGTQQARITARTQLANPSATCRPCHESNHACPV